MVHGTGVRLKSYQSGFSEAKKVAEANGIAQQFVECAWGDAIGVEFEELSLPDGPSTNQKAAMDDDFARWCWLFDDPTFELGLLTTRDTSTAPKAGSNPRGKPAWEELWDKITRYSPSYELNLLLARGGLDDLWPAAWKAIVPGSGVPKAAFKASAHELPDVCRALARAVVAEMHARAVVAERPGISRVLRESLVDRLMIDWDQKVYGLGAYLAGKLKGMATRVVRRRRAAFSAGAALPVGDVLLYQARREGVHDFIREKIGKAEPPVTLVAHSLGGIACVDLLATESQPKVTALVTAGSQAPLLFELGALWSMKPDPKEEPPYALPATFPKWHNYFDRNDFLSYSGKRLFKEIEEKEIPSGQPFPDSHSSYFRNPQFWIEVKNVIGK